MLDLEDFAEFRFAPERVWADDSAVANEAVRRVGVFGDIHGVGAWMRTALRIAASMGCDAVVQVGDFWLQDGSSPVWPAAHRVHWDGDPLPWPDAMRCAVSSPIPVIAVDGNHEAWPCLDRFQQRADVIESRRQGRPLHLGGSLWWADRGSTWTWAGRRCGALGGAVSPDKEWADPAYRWPDSEAPTGGDRRRLIANAPAGLDVLFTHDAPSAVEGLRGELEIPQWIEEECAEARDLLQAAVVATEPELLFHGHWHHANRERIRPADTEVYGLKHEGLPGWAAIVDLAEMQADWLQR